LQWVHKSHDGRTRAHPSQALGCCRDDGREPAALVPATRARIGPFRAAERLRTLHSDRPGLAINRFDRSRRV